MHCVHLSSLRRFTRSLPVLLFAAVAASGAQPVRRPNVLFIACDDLRTDLGAYGHREVRTPHIDELARRGVVFARAYSQQAVCNPSRASLLTGLRPDEIRVWDLSARFRINRPDVVTLPQYFKQNGYTTVGIGKIFHNETLRPGVELTAPMADPVSWSEPPTHATGAHWQDWVVPGDPTGPKKKGDAVQCFDVPDNAYFDGRIADDACAAVRRFKAEARPFFLAVGLWKPHLPFNAPKKYWDLYQREKLAPPTPSSFPQGAPAIAGHTWNELRGYGGVPKTGPLSAAQIAELRHGYYACISFLDAQVGRVLAELKRQGLEENTIVVLWGDHGFHLGEHNLWGKTTNYELDAHAPLIIAASGQAARGQTTAIVEFVDIYPTVVELAGLPARAGLAGTSLVPQLRDPRLPGKPFAVSQHPHPFYGGKPTHMGYALRTPRHRYVEWREIDTGRVSARELYDHAVDPGETVNRVDDATAGAVVEDLAQRAAAVVAAGRRWGSPPP